jgi:hypothetical protein
MRLAHIVTETHTGSVGGMWILVNRGGCECILSHTIPLPAARDCPRLGGSGRSVISDDYRTLYFLSIAMEESGFRLWLKAPVLG